MHTETKVPETGCSSLIPMGCCEAFLISGLLGSGLGDLLEQAALGLVTVFWFRKSATRMPRFESFIKIHTEIRCSRCCVDGALRQYAIQGSLEDKTNCSYQMQTWMFIHHNKVQQGTDV